MNANAATTNALFESIWNEFGDDIIYNLGQEADAVLVHDGMALNRIRATYDLLRNRGATRIWCDGKSVAGTRLIDGAVPGLDLVTLTCYESVNKAFEQNGSSRESAFPQVLKEVIGADLTGCVTDPASVSKVCLVELGWPTKAPFDEAKQAMVVQAGLEAVSERGGAGAGTWVLTDYWDGAPDGWEDTFGLLRFPVSPGLHTRCGARFQDRPYVVSADPGSGPIQAAGRARPLTVDAPFVPHLGACPATFV
ncbi:MAG: hypothetical protein EXR52_00880 [Dehalococcoidia bacterium]|nr:hypothetical protein [Dehalococcoidia bacterium]